ncbi:MAG: site-specific integrase [Acidobacteriota bacterium]|jgi:site-specific recombinase XerD
MLTDFFPRLHRRYSSLPLFGAAMEDFASWSSGHGYHRTLVRRHLRTTRRLDRKLRRRGCKSLGQIPREDLRACSPKDSRDDPNLASTVRLWERYLDERRLLLKPEQTRSELLLNEYCAYLQSVRGAAVLTIKEYCGTSSQLLKHLAYEAGTSRLVDLGRNDIEAFVRVRGERVSRATLQHEIAHLRSFLRFLAARGDIKPGLDNEIDTPHIYTGEQLPRSLPWDTVCAFLASIDRTTPMGLRDYAIFLLIATYGLRSSEIVALKLDDIQWRVAQIRVPQLKGKTPLLLPLTNEVGESIVAYLRRGRPQLRGRELFLRCRAPAGVLKPTAVTEAFQARTKRSGLDIPFQGAHCLRHSYAVHLLCQGTPLKAIGDLLGHISPASTCIYIRLAVEDLRDVALSLPQGCCSNCGEEVRP